ncbi:BapA/Bap/LapF family prefix-like domain-containing protein [Pseudomonas huanghezhanensis]|uniref:BapA/Bap/LapF family prefix-like domain-containing protein n=1 Tax=Pseudomonas huanghezhanensis TaxID=3002903 RepID=UPI002285C1CF|nr:BapA prefix-like domain-containing protein [Pseudomonas sp. BSw22131]
MDNILVADKATSEISANAWGNLQLSRTRVVQMPVAPSHVASVSRSGQDLTVVLKSGERVTVSNFFNTDPNGVRSDMVFQSEDGTLWQAEYSADAFNGFTFDEISSLDTLLADAGVIGSATPTFAIAGLGLLGVGGAAAASEVADVVGSPNGAVVSGKGEAGDTVTVRDENGAVLLRPMARSSSPSIRPCPRYGFKSRSPSARRASQSV